MSPRTTISEREARHVLCAVRLRLRGCEHPIPDPKWSLRAERKADWALGRADELGSTWVEGFRLDREGDLYHLPWGEWVSRAAMRAELVDLLGGAP